LSDRAFVEINPERKKKNNSKTPTWIIDGARSGQDQLGHLLAPHLKKFLAKPAISLDAVGNSLAGIEAS
jgi:hypothetical protein